MQLAGTAEIGFLQSATGQQRLGDAEVGRAGIVGIDDTGMGGFLDRSVHGERGSGRTVDCNS